MKKLLILFLFILSLSSCRREVVTPEDYTIYNNNLPLLKSSEYITANLRCVVQLSQGIKITQEEVKFNQATYTDGSLSLTCSDLCNYLNPNMNLNKTYRCDSYSFSNIIVKKCKP